MTNYFNFLDDFYLKMNGTAMGPTMTPNNANLHMGLLEESFELNTDLNPFFSSIISFNRFIDDLFIVWDNTVENLHKFHQYLHFRNDRLRFALEFSDTLIRRVGVKRWEHSAD